MAIDSAELSQIAAEAADIARSASQQPGTAHLLLAIFTVPGPADVLLRERGCDEDAVLAELAPGLRRPRRRATSRRRWSGRGSSPTIARARAPRGCTSWWR